MSRNMGYDRHITIFSPDGKLYQIEYAFKAIRLPGDTTIGIRGSDSVCLITTKKIEDKLVDPTSVTRIQNITRTIGCIITGRVTDGMGLVYKARQIAANFKFDNGYEIPIRHLSHELANYNQLFTQHAYKRVPGCTIMLCAIDDEIGPKLYLVDPAGSVYGYKAVASGEKESEAMSALEKIIKEKQEEYKKKQENEKEKEEKEQKKDEEDKDKKENKKYKWGIKDSIDMNETQTIETAIEALQKVLGIDYKANQVEIAVVSTQDSFSFRRLTEKQIEQHIVNISERD